MTTDAELETRRRTLMQTPLFADAGADELMRLVEGARLLRFAPDSPLFLKGDPGDQLFIVVRGTVRIGVISPDGREATFRLIGAGQVLGEIAVLDGGPRTADATSVDGVELMAIDRRQLLGYLEQNARGCLRMLNLVCERTRWADELIEDITFLDLGGRLAKRLLQLAHCVGTTLGSPGRVRIRMSQQQLADHLSASRESINKILGTWESDGLIERDRGQLVLCDLGGLRSCITNSRRGSRVVAGV